MKQKVLRAEVAQKYSELVKAAHDDYMRMVAEHIVEAAERCHYEIIVGLFERYNASFDEKGVVTLKYNGTSRYIYDLTGKDAIKYLYENRERIRIMWSVRYGEDGQDNWPFIKTEEVWINRFGNLKDKARAIVFAESKTAVKVSVSVGHVRNSSNVRRGDRVNEDDIPALRGCKRLLEGRGAMRNLYESNKWENGAKRSHCDPRQYKVNRHHTRVAVRAAKWSFVEA